MTKRCKNALRDLTSGQKYLMVSPASLNPLGTPQRQNARSAPPDDKKNCQGGGRGIASHKSHRSLHRSAYRQLVETPFCILQHHELYPASWILEWPSAWIGVLLKNYQTVQDWPVLYRFGASTAIKTQDASKNSDPDAMQPESVQPFYP